jgi:hypothetical protein
MPRHEKRKNNGSCKNRGRRTKSCAYKRNFCNTSRSWSGNEKAKRKKNENKKRSRMNLNVEHGDSYTCYGKKRLTCAILQISSGDGSELLYGKDNQGSGTGVVLGIWDLVVEGERRLLSHSLVGKERRKRGVWRKMWSHGKICRRRRYQVRGEGREEI